MLFESFVVRQKLSVLRNTDRPFTMAVCFRFAALTALLAREGGKPIGTSVPNLLTPSEEPVDGRFAIVVAKWNHSITQKLCDGAIETLTAAGVADEKIDVAWVPGAWEIPVVTQRLADTCRYAAIITLGAVIKGDTPHDHWINQGVTDALMKSATEHSLPILFGVLTCTSMEQAINRAGGTVGNKGSECAEAALEMVQLLRSLPRS